MVAGQSVAHDIAVVFLARGVGGGIDATRAFFDSYAQHPAGIAHRLYIVAKGWDEQGRQELEILANTHAATILDVPDDGYDWGAYFRIVPQLEENLVCFLNTHSRIERSDWLAILAALLRDQVGIVGCTASYSTVGPAFSAVLPIFMDISKQRGLARGLLALVGALVEVLRAVFTGRWRFPAFPNPHIRSNAFLIRRAIFQSYSALHAMPRSKIDAFALESGAKNLTRFIERQRLAALVSGADRQGYAAAQWPESATFRVPNAHNLLVSDNQTRYYERAPRHIRRILEFYAWGRFLSE